MSTNETTTPGAPVWIDLAAVDPQAAIDFYAGLFGWVAEPLDDGWLFRNDGAIVAGLASAAAPARPAGWLVYLLSLDVDSTSLAAHSNGGDVLGRLSDEMIVVKDSQDALVGAWNPGDHSAYLFDRVVGAPTWHELRARDYDSALEFYRNVFEWETEIASDTAEFRYATLGSGDDAIAGIHDAANDLGETRSHWEVYFEVTDADAAAARIVELGGAVLGEVTDSPYGRVAHAADPAGSRFTIVAH